MNIQTVAAVRDQLTTDLSDVEVMRDAGHDPADLLDRLVNAAAMTIDSLGDLVEHASACPRCGGHHALGDEYAVTTFLDADLCDPEPAPAMSKIHEPTNRELIRRASRASR